MVRTAYCTVCARTVYLGSGDSEHCPVCSSALLRLPGASDAQDFLGRRIARNETEFRSRNENRQNAALKSGVATARFVCECGSQDCEERLELPLGDYETVRLNPRRFVIVTGHDVAEVEVVVASHGGWSIVEKIGVPGAMAARDDAR